MSPSEPLDLDSDEKLDDWLASHEPEAEEEPEPEPPPTSGGTSSKDQGR